MKSSFALVLAAYALVLQSAWSPWPLAWLHCDILWLLVLWLAFQTPLSVCGPVALVFGLWQDLLSTPFLGFYPFAYFSVLVLLRVCIAQLFVETVWARVMWTVILTACVESLVYLLKMFLELETGSFFLHLVAVSLSSGVLAALLRPALDAWARLWISRRAA